MSGRFLYHPLATTVGCGSIRYFITPVVVHDGEDGQVDD